MSGMFGPSFGASAADVNAMGLSSSPYQAENQIANGNYNPNVAAPVVNNATAGTSGAAGGMRMTDAQVQSLLNQMSTGAVDPRVGALTLSQNQVNLYDLARISGKSAADIQAAAAANGIRIQDVLGQNGVIQQGGLISGMSMADAAKLQGGAWVDRNAGTGLNPAWEYSGPQGTSYGMDLSRMTMGGPQSQGTVNNWANTAQNNMNANIAANGLAASNLYNGNTVPSTTLPTEPSIVTSQSNSTNNTNYSGDDYHISPSSPFLDRSKAGGWFNFGGAPNNSGSYDPLRPFGGGLPPTVNQAPGATGTLQDTSGALTKVQNNAV